MKILLFSTDEYFLNVFGGFLAKEKIEHDLFCYSNEKAAIEALRAEKYDLIMSEDGYLSEYDKEENYISLGMHTVFPKDEQRCALNIYQKSDRVLEDFEYLVQIFAGKDISTENGKKAMVSFFSTEGGCGKTTLAYLTAAECAKSKKVLYVNLEPLAVTEFLYPEQMKGSMEELLLSFDEEKDDSAVLLLDAIEKNSDNVYVFPTLHNIGDYMELSAVTVLRMLQKATAVCGIEAVIIDLPGAFSPFTETILLESKKIIWVYTDSRNGRGKLELVKNDPYLKSRGILSKSSYVLNRCLNKNSAEEFNAAFPVSESLSKVTKASMVLDMNQEFLKGCKAIAKEVGIL